MWPALLPYPLHSEEKIRANISKVGTYVDSLTLTLLRPTPAHPDPSENCAPCSSHTPHEDSILRETVPEMIQKFTLRRDPRTFGKNRSLKVEKSQHYLKSYSLDV